MNEMINIDSIEEGGYLPSLQSVITYTVSVCRFGVS
jgi:hypothetical protein